MSQDQTQQRTFYDFLASHAKGMLVRAATSSPLFPIQRTPAFYVHSAKFEADQLYLEVSNLQLDDKDSPKRTLPPESIKHLRVISELELSADEAQVLCSITDQSEEGASERWLRPW